MMVDANIERMEVAAMYSGPSWKAKVKKMSAGQIHAIYMKEQEKKAKAKEEEKKKREDEELW